mmetsp:Transcript_23689/g.41968  ORF Transcript_23689/g.41968 Transcript_23689/m.41968 type:complete len:426 (+) Transcript_23689:55-1332(+)
MTDDEFYDAFEELNLVKNRLSIYDPISEVKSPVDKLLESNTSLLQQSFTGVTSRSDYSSGSASTDQESAEVLSDQRIAITLKEKDCSEFENLAQVQTIKLEQIVTVGRVCDNGTLVALGGDEGFLAAYSISPTLEPLSRLRVWFGHRNTIQDIAWSPSNTLLLSASHDRCVMLWSIDQSTPLSEFSHPDFISSVDFHLGNPSFFITGCYDKVLRLWSIPNSRTFFSQSFNDTITCTKFSPDGALLVVGFHNGICEVYAGEIVKDLQSLATLNCRNRRGLQSRGKRVTGLEFSGDHTLLVSTNDSRMRLFSLRDFSLQLKYKGHGNIVSWTYGSFSSNSLHIISGSDNGQVYIWTTQPCTLTHKVSCYEAFRPSRAKQILSTCFWRETALRSLREALCLQSIGVSHALLVVDSLGELRVYYNYIKI